MLWLGTQYALVLKQALPSKLKIQAIKANTQKLKRGIAALLKVQNMLYNNSKQLETCLWICVQHQIAQLWC